MGKFKKTAMTWCAVFTTVILSACMVQNAQAASKKYVTSISSVKVNGTSVKSGGTYKLYTGSTTPSVKITSKVNTKGSASKSLSYSSSKKSIATVSSKGVISAKKAGTTVITLKTKAKNNKGKYITYKINIKVYSTSLSCSDPVSLTRTGTNKNPTTTFSIKTSNMKSYTITNSSTNTLTLTKKSSTSYTITAKKAGTAKITVKAVSADNKATRTITRTVKVIDQAATGLSVTQVSSIAMTDTAGKDITATVSGNPVVGGYTVTSSDTTIASISGTKVIPVKTGTVTITVTTNDGAQSKSFSLTVAPASESYTIPQGTVDHITISDVSTTGFATFFYTDFREIAKQVLIGTEDTELTVSIGGIHFLAEYDKTTDTMEYTQDGQEVTLNDAFFSAFAVSDVTFYFPEDEDGDISADLAMLFSSLTYTDYTSAEKYDISFLLNGSRVDVKDFYFKNGYMNATLGDTNFTSHFLSDGVTMVIDNDSDTSVTFSDTTSGQALIAAGFFKKVSD